MGDETDQNMGRLGRKGPKTVNISGPGNVDVASCGGSFEVAEDAQYKELTDETARRIQLERETSRLCLLPWDILNEWTGCC